MEKRIALVVGATGAVGTELVHMLLDQSIYAEVHVWTRRPTGMHHDRLVEHLVDFHDAKQLVITDKPKHVDDVYCCLGTTIKRAGSQAAFRFVDVELPLLIANSMLQRGMRRFLLVTAMGANPDSRVFYSRMKGLVESELKALQIPQLHIFRPSLLLATRSEFRFGEQIASLLFRALRPLFRGPLRKYAAIETTRVAQAMVRTAIEAEETFPAVRVIENEEMLRM